MAKMLRGLSFTAVAGSNLTANQYTFVKMSNDDTVDACGEGDASIGILQNNPNINEAAEVWVTGISKLVVGSVAVTAGERLASGAGGVGIASDGGDYENATVFEGAPAGDICSVLIGTSTPYLKP